MTFEFSCHLIQRVPHSPMVGWVLPKFTFRITNNDSVNICDKNLWKEKQHSRLWNMDSILSNDGVFSWSNMNCNISKKFICVGSSLNHRGRANEKLTYGYWLLVKMTYIQMILQKLRSVKNQGQKPHYLYVVSICEWVLQLRHWCLGKPQYVRQLK